jgi:aminoglycoside/choline kinase family phosphotransferase
MAAVVDFTSSLFVHFSYAVNKLYQDMDVKWRVALPAAHLLVCKALSSIKMCANVQYENKFFGCAPKISASRHVTSRSC